MRSRRISWMSTVVRIGFLSLTGLAIVAGVLSFISRREVKWQTKADRCWFFVLHGGSLRIARQSVAPPIAGTLMQDVSLLDRMGVTDSGNGLPGFRIPGPRPRSGFAWRTNTAGWHKGPGVISGLGPPTGPLGPGLTRYFVFSYTNVVIPLWTIPAIGIVPFAIIEWTDWRRRRRARAIENRICVECGYDLRASANRCPECGRPISQS